MAGVELFTIEAPEGYEVERYLGVVSAPVYVGVNALRDWAAGWRDVLGGRTKSYETAIEATQGQAGEKLIELARDRGANAVLGMRLDTDVVSGARKGAMVLVNAFGTAAVLREVGSSSVSRLPPRTAARPPEADAAVSPEVDRGPNDDLEDLRGPSTAVC